MIWKMVRDFAERLIPWQKRIKDIESHFGSVVSSYFVFLRWIFWMNFAIMLVLTIAVILPEVNIISFSENKLFIFYPVIIIIVCKNWKVKSLMTHFLLQMIGASSEDTAARKNMLPVEKVYGSNFKVFTILND